MKPPVYLYINVSVVCFCLSLSRIHSRLCKLHTPHFDLLSPPDTCPPAPSPVCPRRLPHGALHPAMHHHAGQAAHPEQPVWDRHTVSAECTHISSTDPQHRRTKRLSWTTHHNMWVQSHRTNYAHPLKEQPFKWLSAFQTHLPGNQTYLLNSGSLQFSLFSFSRLILSEFTVLYIQSTVLRCIHRHNTLPDMAVIHL